MSKFGETSCALPHNTARFEEVCDWITGRGLTLDFSITADKMVFKFPTIEERFLFAIAWVGVLE